MTEREILDANTSSHAEDETVEQQNRDDHTFSDFIGSFWGIKIDNKLVIRHDPDRHEWRAVDRASEKLLKGILANDRYPEEFHSQLLNRAFEYGLRVICIESTDSMLSVLKEMTACAIKKEAEPEDTCDEIAPEHLDDESFCNTSC